MTHADGEVSALRHARDLAEFTRCVYSVDVLEDLLTALSALAGRVLGADSVHIGQIDHVHGRMRMLRNAGLLADWEQEAPPEESYLIADLPHLLYTGELAASWRGNIDDAIADNDRDLLASQGKAHGLSVPLVSASGVWGELYVTRVHSEPFSDEDEETATVVAGLAGMGLVRVLGDLRLRELAYTDALTGLANRRAADEQLEAWAADPGHARELTVVLCDVNGLKAVNDTHGHLVGDQLIREAAGHVSTAAGRLPGGFAARVGGDEFLIASSCPDRLLVEQVVKELTEAAAQLPYGGGLSCGSAWAGDLIRPEPTPQARVHSLLRIADSEQYRRKLAIRGLPSASAVAEAVAEAERDGEGETAQPGERWVERSGPRIHRDLAAAPPTRATEPGAPRHDETRDETRDALNRHDERGGAADMWHSAPVESAAGLELGPSASAEERLRHGAHAICLRSDAVAWWISTVDLVAQTVRAVSCGKVRREDVTDGLWPPVEIDPTVYALSDFPSTEHAVRTGDAFYVDTLTGDDRERRLLMQLGYQCVIAAGGTASGTASGTSERDTVRHGWLLEIYGDSLTQNLREFTGTLQQLAEAAINGA